MVREQAFRFGDRNSLMGIITNPASREKAQALPSVLILNSGLIHRVGPNRLSVRIAREMASLGFTVLRFDFSGIGDSEARTDTLPFAKSSVVEAKQAMDFMNKARGSTRFIVMGICSGADSAYSVALADERVIGIVPIDFYSAPSAAYQMHEYKRRLVRPRSWVKFMTGQSDLWSILKKVPGRLMNRNGNGTTHEIEEPTLAQPVEEFVPGFKKMIDRKVHICLIFSAGSPAFFNYKQLFEAGMKALFTSGQLVLHYLNKSDHGFTLEYNQSLLIDTIRKWILQAILEGTPESEYTTHPS